MPNQLLAVLLVVGVFAAATGWLLKQPLFWAFLAVIVPAWYLIAKAQRERESDDFQQLVLRTLRNRMPPDEAKRINVSLMGRDFRKAQLIRALQIIRDSFDIALAGKNRDVSESRLTSAKQFADEIRRDYLDLMTPETRSAVLTEIARDVSRCHTAIYVNAAKAAIEKAATMKTAKAKARHLDSARQHIADGQTDPNSDKAALAALEKSLSAAERT